MSEFTNHKEERLSGLLDLFLMVINEEVNPQKVQEFQQLIDRTQPADVIGVVDQLVGLKIPMDKLKKGINKSMNLLYKTLSDYPYSPPKPNSFLDLLLQNNDQLDIKLKAFRQLVKDINRQNGDEIRTELKARLNDLMRIELHYQIKENIFFPLIEKFMPDYRCLQVMWSFHDDVRRNLKYLVQTIDSPDFDLNVFNRATGDLYFNAYAIKFREERILFPIVAEYIPEQEFERMITESMEIGFPFVRPKLPLKSSTLTIPENPEEVNLMTGLLSPEQIRLIFNHLPVDITYVDEHNKVKFFSTPEKRIFRRTNSIIGRDVKNCHPHESVHVVEEIVEAFRKGKKDKASFWIKMKGEFILIQYFAVRDEQGNYKGVIEVSQEISEIQALEGEKRLLDWTS